MDRAIYKQPLHYRSCLRHSAHKERFKALTNSGAAISLVLTSIYNMIEDHYTTKILPSVVHLKAADRSSMLSLGKVTLHLHIANFKFPHTFIILDELPETDILLGIQIQRYSLVIYLGLR